MRSAELYYVFAIALALSSCSANYDCRSKPVHDKLFSILRDNFYDVISKSDEPSLKGIATVAGLDRMFAVCWWPAPAVSKDRGLLWIGQSRAPSLARAGHEGA